MPRQPDPDLENRILNAAHVLWKRGGEKSLTMRAVAKAAKTNTPAVYRRFKNRGDLLRGLLLRISDRIRKDFAAGETLEHMAEAYVDSALRQPHDYELFYSHAEELSKGRRGPVRAIRDTRPNFGFVEDLLAKRLGGRPEDYTQLALAIWATLHGTTMLLLTKAIPEGHIEELRSACRMAVKMMLDSSRA